MISRDAEVIGHVPPRRAIELRSRPTSRPAVWRVPTVQDILDDLECVRRNAAMWAAVVEFAGGGALPPARPLGGSAVARGGR